jgi:hypothetical protein
MLGDLWRFDRHMRFAVRSGSTVQTQPSSFSTIHLDDNAILNNDDNLPVTQPAKRVTNRFECLVVQRGFIATYGYWGIVQFRAGHG